MDRTEDFLDSTSLGLIEGPSGHSLRRGIHLLDDPEFVGGDDSVRDGVEGDMKFLLALAERCGDMDSVGFDFSFFLSCG